MDWGPTDVSTGNTVTGSSWKNSDSLTLNGASISDCNFQNSNPVIVGNDLGNVSGCSFTRGAAGHAIETSVSTGTIAFNNNTFSGYGSDGTSTAAINFTATTGSVTVNVSGAAVPTFLSAGVTVSFVLSNSLTLTGLKTNTEIRVYDAGTTTELAGEENNVTGTFNTSVSVSAVDIVIFALEYIAIRLTNVDTTSDRTIPIQQQEDRQYENP